MPSYRHWRRDDDDAINVECPTCHAQPGEWCVYVGNVLRAGTETRRLHVERTHDLWFKTPAASPKRHRMTPALSAVEAFQRAENRQLREWLRLHAHLLLGPDLP